MSSRVITPIVFWLGLVAAGLALWWSGQAGHAWGEAQRARIGPLAIVVVIGMTLPLIHAARWVLLMRALDSDLSPALAADLTVTASLVNYASPGYLGAPAKAVLANRSAGAPVGRSLITMAFEQGLDFVTLGAASGLALLVFGPRMARELTPSRGASPLALGLAVAAVALVAVAALVFHERVGQLLARIATSFRMLGWRVDKPRVAALTALYWLAQALVVALLLWALRLPLSVANVLALASLPLLAGQLAPLPGGIGAREAAIVALAGVTGASATGLLGLAVLQRVLLVAALPLALGMVRVCRLAGAQR